MFRHQLLIDAMLKWKTLDYEEIDLLLSKKSLEALQKYREDNEKKRKQATGKDFSSWLDLGQVWARRTVTWGASYRWSASLYCPMRNSDQMTIGKTHHTLRGVMIFNDYLIELHFWSTFKLF